MESLRAIPSPTPVGRGAGNGGNETGGIVINNNPTIIINGDKPEDLEEKMEKNNQNLLRMVMELLENREERRTLFA